MRLQARHAAALLPALLGCSVAFSCINPCSELPSANRS